MVEVIWIIFGLFASDFVIAWLIRRSGLERPFTAITIISVILPVGYSVAEWNVGVMNGTYTVNDLNERVTAIMLYGIGVGLTGGVIGGLVGGFGKSNSSS